jgi:hypothetical protein
MSDTILVIDGDEIAYQVAAACEQRGILVTNTTNEAQSTFKHRTEMKNFLSGLEVPEDFYVVEDTQIAEPARNAFATIKSKLLNLKDKFETDKIELYLSGSNNFRLGIPLPTQYKSGRSDLIRPLLLTEIKEYLIKYHGAVVVEGDEADSMISQRMYDGYRSGQKIIASSIDKDARGSSGWLYNPDKDELLYIDGFGDIYLDEKGKLRGHGRKWLYAQILLGDKTDGFCPRTIVNAVTGKTPRYGEKQCFNSLSVATDDKEALQIVHDTYLGWFGADEFTYTAWNGEEVKTDYIGAMQMIWDCAFMRRWDGDNPEVIKMLDKMGIKH